jgi:hypothetical protein
MTRRRRLLRSAIGAAAVGALGYVMRSMIKAVTREGPGSGGKGDTSAADGGKDTGRPGRVRTEGETAVDEAMGQGPLPQQ